MGEAFSVVGKGPLPFLPPSQGTSQAVHLGSCYTHMHPPTGTCTVTSYFATHAQLAFFGKYFSNLCTDTLSVLLFLHMQFTFSYIFSDSTYYIILTFHLSLIIFFHMYNSHSVKISL